MAKVHYEAKVTQVIPKAMGAGYELEVRVHTRSFSFRRFEFIERIDIRKVKGEIFFNWLDTGVELTHFSESALIKHLKATIFLHNDSLVREKLLDGLPRVKL